MKDLTLVIMAAGMGSRYGGLKQIEPVGPNGEFIIDYSIYDAIQAGFNKVVFIIKKENYEIFRETVGKRIEGKIKCEYAFQDLNDLPGEFKAPEGRERPWGTVHAILAAKPFVKENFAIINADDFYSATPYKIVSDFFATSASVDEYLIPPYEVKATLSENGAVKRGICEVANGYLTSIVETSVIREANEIIASPLDGRPPFTVAETAMVSMNVYGFTPKIFEVLESSFLAFLERNKTDLTKCEYLISELIEEELAKKDFKMKVISHSGKWFGITFKEDKTEFIDKINESIQLGEYPQQLW